MGRRKLKISEMIENKKAVNRSYNNRKMGILKKASELSTLCDVDVGVIIFGSKQGDDDEAPLVWPKEPEKLNGVIRRYLNTSIDERSKRATDVSSFVKQQNQQVPKFGAAACDKKKNLILDERIGRLSVEQLVGMVNCLDSEIGVFERRIELMMKQSNNVGDGVVQGVQSCGGAEQGNTMNMMMMNMMNESAGCNPTPTDVDVGDFGFDFDFSGLTGNAGCSYTNLSGGGMTAENVMNEFGTCNRSPLVPWYSDDDLAQLQHF